MEAIAQRQLDAYNRQDLEAFCACFTEEVVVSEFPDQVLLCGRAALSAHYRDLFRKYPMNRAELLARIVTQSHVLDHERVWRSQDQEPFEVVAIYGTDGYAIRRVDFAR